MMRIPISCRFYKNSRNKQLLLQQK